MLRFIFSLFLISFLSCSSVFANTTPSINNSTQDVNIKEVTVDLDKIEKEISKNTLSKNDSVILIKKLNDYYSGLQTKKEIEAKNLSELQKKVTALGELIEGERETSEISKQRATFGKEIEGVKAEISKTDLALARIDSLNQKIADLRKKGLLGTLMVKEASILDFKELSNALFNFGAFLWHLLEYPLEWYKTQTPEVQSNTLHRLLSLVLWAAGSLFFAIILNIFVRKKLGYDLPIEKPTYTQKVQAGIFMILARAVIPAAIPVAFLIWRMQNPDFLVGSFGILTDIFAHYLIYLFFLTGLSSVLFTPKKTQWRLIEVSNERALEISKSLIYSIYALCFFSFLHVAAQKLGSSEETIYAIKMINNFVKSGCIIVLALNLLYDSKKLTEEEFNTENEVQGLSFTSKLSILISLASFVVLCYSMFGYVRLAEYIYNRFIVSVMFIAVGYIFQKFIFVLFHQILSKKFWGQNLRITKNKIKRIELLFNVLTIPVVSGFIILCILGAWGVSIDIMVQNIKKIFTGFDIGDMHVSPSSILLGLLAFFITHYAFKTIKNSLAEGKLGEIFDLDIGVKTSIAALIGFVGTILALIVGLSVMGGSLKGLAIAAGALSLGAGLGLQNVVNNFVSGLILLFERPFKIGDWILVDQYEGIVKQINMRSTQIETFNKANVIIPNATLLSTSLINMTYKNKQARVDLLVGVDYDSDIELVKSTLLDCVKETKNILQVPNPFVAFLELADNSLNFRLSFYISDVGNKLSIQTEVYTLIVEKFREKNINIPYPQRVLHVKNETDLKETDIVTD